MKKQQANQQFNVPLPTPVFQGRKHLRIALVGMPNSGKSTLFQAVSATSIQTGELAGTHLTYGECPVQIGFDEARLVDLPSIQSLTNLSREDLVALQYLYGEISRHRCRHTNRAHRQHPLRHPTSSFRWWMPRRCSNTWNSPWN